MNERESEEECLLRMFVHYLKHKGYRVTSDRQVIAGWVLLQRRPFTVEDLLEAMPRAGLRQSRMTIFTTVRLLRASGVILELPFKGASHYLTAIQARRYAVCLCRHCGKWVMYRQEVCLRQLPLRLGRRLRQYSQPLLIYNGLCRCCGAETPS